MLILRLEASNASRAGRHPAAHRPGARKRRKIPAHNVPAIGIHGIFLLPACGKLGGRNLLDENTPERVEQVEIFVQRVEVDVVAHRKRHDARIGAALNEITCQFCRMKSGPATYDDPPLDVNVQR